MKHVAKKKGFTLMELMIVMAIIAILVTLALPSYTRYIRKANRGEAQQLLMNWANNKEIWRANNPTYDDSGAIPDPTMSPARYIFSESNVTATTYTLSAVAQGDQTKDEDKGKNCTTLTINQSNTKGPLVGGVSFCW